MACVLVLELSLRGFDASVYTQVRLVELEWLDTLATATLLPAIAATAVVVIRAYRRHSGGVIWATVTLVLLVSIVALTIMVNLPINAQQLDWVAGAPPRDWAQVRNRWQIAHLMRTVAAVAAFTCLINFAMRPHRRQV
ncbi:anthrone oxygenase family protein [Nocardia gipuzkoensis]